VLALLAFAANSVLCRIALKSDMIDAASFTAIRLISATLVLFLIIALTKKEQSTISKGSWPVSLMLFVYMVFFSYAYVLLDVATGALILAASVQFTMIASSIKGGSKLHPIEWIGLMLASWGFIYLMLPHISAPSITSLLLMTIAGVAWGFYTLKGKPSINPLYDTSYNFLRTMPLLFIFMVFNFQQLNFSLTGLVIGIIAGGLTSGVGYVIWYIAIKGLTSSSAAVLQLSIAVIAALGGSVFVEEAISMRLAVSALMVLGGAFLVISGRRFINVRVFSLNKYKH